MRLLNAIKQKITNRKVTCCNTRITPSVQAGEGKQECSFQEDHAGRYLVVASHDTRFSESAMEYALDMAERMDYNLIALNAISLEHPVIDALSSSTDSICRDCEMSARKNAEFLCEKAKDKGLSFVHLVHFNTVDSAIDEIRNEYPNIEFVVSADQGEEHVVDRPEKEIRVEQRLCVYAMN